MADKIRNISGSKCFLPPLWTKWTGILWIVRMTGAWCRLVSWRCHTMSRDSGLGSQLWTWERVESGVGSAQCQWCVWIFPVSVRTICLPSSLNFLQHRVTLTQVQARGESWDGITITKNIFHRLKISTKLLILWIFMDIALTQCFTFETRVN